MKKIVALLSVLLFSISSFSQSCCQLTFASNEGNMAKFTTDENFIASHQIPLDYKHNSVVGGEMITFKTIDVTDGNAYLVKSKTKSKKWLFVYQEWWGLNDYIKRQADILYNEMGGNVNILAIDMYDGKVATTREDAAKYMQGADEKRLENIVNGALGYVGKKAKVASIGWCFGGGWSLKSAILSKKQAIGSVMYYGMPVQDVEKLKTLNCEVLGLFATEEWISKKVIEEFAANMKLANKSLNYKIFEAAHAFANPSNPKFDEKASTEANAMALKFLKEKFNLK
ncbi:dienelactone hydrolase family protein [Flavobacterium terrigena]|uniref:Carboxymethylenebutenolidase n=1 Tax=Flavobacterium terrigena TaxID=402734 RepID=A0A1H6RU17_9FLAO|nr:dienelactone hydrolase family protein [Flavobacterium terrigena]SEI56037.1 carboxymethylenebutenolidase [Flavobacterium terrigena]